ncbi:Uncharacterized protein Adt_10991 [Abeliophyllum distichum]|uniref:Uncharacterized protein n=1 Tax=Abeliophyllum distichum TaxID=126358 RepID=A0ABD1ULZ3_9LAMI
MKYRLPLREIVVDFYNELKSITSGYASFDYEDADYQASDLVKLDILLNGQPVDAVETIVHRLKAQCVGRELVEKLKKFIDRQMFEITIQAAIGSKVIARETFSNLGSQISEFVKSTSDLSKTSILTEALKAPKSELQVLGDLVESITDAMLIGTNLDLHKVWKVFKPLLSPIVTPDNLEFPPCRELIELCDSLGYFIKSTIHRKETWCTQNLKYNLKMLCCLVMDWDMTRKLQRGWQLFIY